MYKLFRKNYRKISLLLVLAGIFNFQTRANPGDTTFVTVYNLQPLTHYGNYDTLSIFPTGKRYSKITLHYIVGRYACAPGTQYCGSWDYTTMLIAQPAGKDSAELARVITPYAGSWSVTKKHDYTMDITDYASLLEGPTSMRFRYEGYSWGFTITLKIELIEGIPAMDALSVRKVYSGYYAYGNNSNPIENHLTAKTFSYSAPTSKVVIKNSVSGHGNDATGCSEFCNKYYKLKINNNQVAQKQLWRDDCDKNPVSPQAGTWLYSRANWCPGAIVWPIYHDITGNTTPNTTFSVDVDMQPYSVSNPSGGYNWVSQLIEYSAPNNTRDASIENIIVPNNNENFVRENPSCINPVIRVKNTGTDSINEIVFSYGLTGKTPVTYTWTGSLHFLHDTDLVFPNSPSVFTNTLPATFEVSVVSVNGVAGDDNLLNNSYRSVAPKVTPYPDNFSISIQTNHSAFGAGQSETSYLLYDESGNVVFDRSVLVPDSFYRDTIGPLPYGCYKLVVSDEGCNGLYNPFDPNAGTGSIFLKAVNSSFANSFPAEFGCGFVKYFSVVDPNPPSVGIQKPNAMLHKMDVYPSPAANFAVMRIVLAHEQNIAYTLRDIAGKTILSKSLNNVTSLSEKLDLGEMANGIYILSVELEDHLVLSRKLVIQR
jgi:hypothetical protein